MQFLFLPCTHLQQTHSVTIYLECHLGLALDKNTNIKSCSNSMRSQAGFMKTLRMNSHPFRPITVRIVDLIICDGSDLHWNKIGDSKLLEGIIAIPGKLKFMGRKIYQVKIIEEFI